MSSKSIYACIFSMPIELPQHPKFSTL
ncbi:hypothetical protein A2U01_0043999, partial [Trifolium medium]|nr:hypothetical protein [Trifolium medium]